MNTWKALFAKDRWEILRIGYYLTRGGNPYASKIQLRNRYSGRVRSVDRDGVFELSDFPHNTYR